MMKIIATGKGGVGKTTLVSTLCRMLARDGFKVLVFDTDPSMNLAMTMGVPFAEISTLAEDKAEIGEAMSEHREEVDFDDVIADHSALTEDRVRVVIMGTVPAGGAGCLCSPISMVKVLVESLKDSEHDYDFVVVDSQAGPEILGRGLASSFDCNLVVTEAMPKAIEVTRQVLKLSSDLNIRRTLLVLNKVEGEKDLEAVKRGLGVAPADVLTIRQDNAVKEADRNLTSVLDDDPGSPAVVDMRRIKEELMALKA